MLNAQVLALALIPLLSGAVPRDGVLVSPMSLLGIEEHVTAEFMTGSWRCLDEFFKWGVTDKEKSTVKSFRGRALMSLSKDGEIKMTNFFRPAEGRWELASDRLIIYDPRFPERTPQSLPVRKRDNNKIWVLLPFTGGAAGIGMVRVPDGEMSAVTNSAETQQGKQFNSSGRQRETIGETLRKEKRSENQEMPLQEREFLIISPTRQEEPF